MKYFLLAVILFTGGTGSAQSRQAPVFPVLANLTLTDENGTAVDANRLAKGQTVRLSFTVINPSMGRTVAAGSCRLQLHIGNALVLLKKEPLDGLSPNGVMRWVSATDAKGNTTLTGALVDDLPADFAATFHVTLACTETGSSRMSAQWFDKEQRAVGSLSAVDCSVQKAQAPK